MDDTDIPHPILKQVPLMKNPAFQPPKPITLNTNYSKLIPTLSTSSIPPKINIGEEDLVSWKAEIVSLKEKVSTSENEDPDVARFNEWIKLQQVRVAPGFDSFDGVMQPSKRPLSVNTPEKDINELDKVFGNTSL